jgi:hypothetical protein
MMVDGNFCRADGLKFGDNLISSTYLLSVSKSLGGEPLRKNLSWRTFELFESWMSTCLLDHTKCADSLAGQTIDNVWREDGLGRTELPSRVLDVLDDGNVIKLVETKLLDQKRAPHMTQSHY